MSTRRSQIVTMGFPDRGEENLMRQTSRCKNFQPNMFTKTKCQNCFRTREAHDLGDDDGSNKPKKAIQYGYLFVAPGIDFDNPMSRNRKWQRRCFVLYENGELCYGLDYDPNTIPQGVVDMYQCTKVFPADKLTGHPFSMGVATPDETTYIRAETREEKDSWYMTLIEYPEINKENERQKKRKRGVFPMTGPKDSETPQKIEEAEAKPDVPPSRDDPASKLSEMDHDLAVESRDEPSDILTTTARDTTDILTATSKAARKEKSNLRRSHSALEQRPEKYDKRQASRKPPTGTDPTSTEKHREDRLVRRHTASGRTESKAYSRGEGLEGKGDSTKRPLSDGSSYVYSGSSSLRSRPSESGLADLEREIGTTDPSTKSQRESHPAHSGMVETSLHRNNNNVYKDLSPRSSPTHQASSRKSSTSERSTSPTDSQSTTESLTKKSQPSKADTNSQNLLSQEELQRMDVPKRGRFRLNKALIEGETQSPSKRTIERRRHAQERRNRHTLDGSTVPFPISERKSKSSESPPRLKRSNSDPNLADNEDVKRKEIAETFPGLLHLKNGWLMMMGPEQEEWIKFWFVLRDNKLSFFKDSSDESPNNLAGAVDLAECKEATETTASRNYGFQVKMEDGTVHKLGAMTSGIRTNWIHAINKAIATAQQQASCDAPIGNLKKADQPVKQSATPDVIPTPAPKQDSTDASSSTVDLTARHRKNSTDSRASGTTSPTEKDPVFHERQGSIRSKERRSRRGSRGDDLKSQKRSSSRSSVNGRSSSTSSEIFETPPNTPVPVELRIEEPVKPSPVLLTRSERTSATEGLQLVDAPQVEVQKIEADSLKSEQPVVDNIQLENIQSRTNLTGVRKTPSPDNENEQKALVSQLETVVKKLSQVELHNQTLQMEVKQARNASELLKHEKEELQEKLQNSTSSLEKRGKECDTLQSRFEKLVHDLQESETEVSKARSSLKAERDKALTMIERLNQQIEVLETEKKESKERMKKWEADSGSQQKHMRQLEKNQVESQEIIKKLIAKMEGYKQKLEAKGEDGSMSQTQKLQELQEANKQLQVRLEETEQQLEAKKEVAQSAPNVETESELESELADLRMELSEKDEQIEQLSEQLEEEYSERSELQKKYDNLCTESAQFILEGQGDKAATSPVGELEEKLHKAVAQVETLNMQLNNESSQRKQAEGKLSGELSEKQKLERTIHELEEQLRSIADKSEEPHAQEDVKNLMELLQGKNKEVEKLQSEVKRIDTDRQSLMEQSSKLQVDMDTMKEQLKQYEESKSTLEGDLECVLQSKLDLEESAKQTATELATVKSELEILRQASQNAASAAAEAAKLEAAQKEVLLLQAQVEKVQKVYTDDMFKKEQLLAEEQEKSMEVERKLIVLQSRATQREEEIAKHEREEGEKLLAMTQQVEQLGQKAERGEKELKRLRADLKTSQDNYDALELKHMQSIEESKQQQKSQQEQLELMGRRIQDLTSKLGSAERKVRDLASVEAGWSSFGGGGNSSIHRVHLGAESGATCISPSSGIHSQLKEVEEVLGSAECRIQRQQQKASALEGKIESVEKHMEAIEQTSPSSNLSSVDHDVSVNSSSSPSSHSSINQLAGVTTPAPKQADISDTSDSSDCPSSDGADGSSKIKILESRLAEMEQKLKQVTHRLVDVTTRELEKRKAYQAKCIAENKLKDQVRGLQREVLALRQQMEKVQSHSESSARQTHSVLTQCRQHLVRILPAKFQQTIGLGGTDSPGVHKGPTNTAANPTDKSTTAAPSSVAAAHVQDACHTLDKALDILISQLKSLDKRKRKSLTEFSESIIHGLSGDVAHFSDGECPKSPISCPTSPLFFPTSPTISPDISPRSGKVSDLRFSSFMKFPTKSYESSFIGGEKLQRIRYGHCLLEVEYLNSFLEDMSGQGCAEEDVAKLLSCHRMLEAEEHQSVEDVRSVGDGRDVSGFAGGLSTSIIKEAESEFLSMKEPAEHGNVIGSHEISAVYSACTTFFTNNWEYSHALEKQLEEACDDLAKDLAEETAAKKEECQSESKKSIAKTKQPSRTQSQRSGGKNDSGLGLEADLAPFAEGIAYEEALRVAMECVSSELVLAEALQCVNVTIEDFVKKIDVEEQKCKRILVFLKDVGTHRFNLIRDAIARQLEATSGLIRQKYWDYLQESEDEGDGKIEESKKRKKTANTKENQKNGTTKGLQEDHEGVLEKEVAILILMKAVLSGLVVHFRSELSLLAEGNSNQNNNSISGLPPSDFFDLDNPISISDPSESTTEVCKESREGDEGVGGNWAGAVRPRASTLERISAEHSRNIAMVRERYEAILKGERKVHEQELIQLRQRLLTANAAVKGLEEDVERMGRSDETLDQKGLQTHLRRGHREIREAQQELNYMKSDILELVHYHEMKLGHIAEGIHAITTCYQRELEQLHAHYERLLGEAEDRGQRELVKAHQKYKMSIAEMERHHVAQTKRLVKEAKQQQGDEVFQAQQRSHRKALEEMQRTHRQELEEKEQAWRKEKENEDEAVTTAISAVKRAYEAELEKERRLSGDSSPKEVESIMKRHREVVDQMNKDWLILSQKFSEQCRENSTLSKALRAMQRSQREAYERLQRAQVENRQRVDSLGQELARLEGMVQGGDAATGGGGASDEGEGSDSEEESSEEVKLMQVNLKLRELELEFAQEEIESLRRSKEQGRSVEASAGQKSGAEQPGAGETAHRGSFASVPAESDGSTRPKSRRSLSDLTTRFYKSKKSDKK